MNPKKIQKPSKYAKDESVESVVPVADEVRADTPFKAVTPFKCEPIVMERMGKVDGGDFTAGKLGFVYTVICSRCGDRFFANGRCTITRRDVESFLHRIWDEDLGRNRLRAVDYPRMDFVMTGYTVNVVGLVQRLLSRCWQTSYDLF